MGVWWLFLIFFPFFFSYGIYPFILWLFSKFVKGEQKSNKSDFLPNIFIITAAHNEDSIIKRKMESIISLDYPKEKIFVYIGLDACTDETFSIISEYKVVLENIHTYQFNLRMGKPKIINFLVDKVKTNHNDKEDLLFLSDANVLLDKNVFKELVLNFVNEEIGLVDCKFLPISNFEKLKHEELLYSNFETFIKKSEGKLWGKMMGPTGGGFMMRKSLFEAIPENFIVDDFYLALQVFKKNKNAILDVKAICFEDFNGNLKDEFKRKRRISSGNFQNLALAIKHFNLFSPIFWFCFFSHKIIRWLSPIWFFSILLLIFFESLVDFHFIKIALFIITLIISPTIVDLILSGINLHLNPLKRLNYFFVMNLGLFFGFFDYLKGIKSNVWEPTKRIQ
jgi:cellulose synthase/poly-beta-1,6-N-acetylglucosamine synthase-like glycosyltransferase